MNASALALVAFAAGVMLAAQGPIYARLASYAGGPIQAAIVAFATGLAALLALCVFTNAGAPKLLAVLRMPGWIWAGSLIGTAMVLLTVHAVPRIGVATFVAAVVCGQLVAALGFDHVGAFGVELRRISWRDVAGALCLLAGLLLIVADNKN
jgi:transporter family-2 protein